MRAANCKNGIVAYRVADARLALERHDALAVVVEELDAHLVVERRDELAIGVVRLLAWLPGVFDTARAAELELALDGALRAADARHAAERESNLVVVERRDVSGERLDVLEVAALGRREALELRVDAPEAVGEAEEVRRDDHVEGRTRDEDDAGADHVAQLLVGEVVAELVEDAVGREVRVERRAEVGWREVAAEFVVEHLRRVPHDVARFLVEL